MKELKVIQRKFVTVKTFCKTRPLLTPQRRRRKALTIGNLVSKDKLIVGAFFCLLFNI